MMQKN